MTTGTSAAVVSRLAQENPVAVSGDLLSRASSFKITLKIRDNFSPTQGLSIQSITVTGSPDQAREYAAVVRRAMYPAPDSMIRGWIAELDAITASPAEDEDTIRLKIASYLARLREFPADIVRTAMLEQRWKFFPTWADLGEVCDRLVAPRRCLLRALDRVSDGAVLRPIVPSWQQTTPAQRRASAARIMAEVYGG